ncbi:hypothetical protein H4R33_001972 [Dimargaris cristalligena]|uniref:General substrate transporter n=1 Tax=Dimargaris cristalligena TaxID=215637 RepID=A0A4P9ZZR7_9FUNG|nr:hypothetical protein H4R33_001972 [Dimargaris cristalligena]RKP38938.1 general substrate transporter [Dimargaris cristalligena]|eukprot:RKP38938.1 general substrate transporter [Dimargaris cristalligena]
MGSAQVYLAASIAAIGGFLFGYDTGVISGTLDMPNFKAFYSNPDATMRGTIVSMLTLGCFIGSLGSGYLADRIGRKFSIVLGSVVFIVGAVLQTTATGVGMLIAGRIIAGLGVGILSMCVPVFQSEIAPTDIRGRLVSLQQLAITIGIAVSFWIDYGCEKLGPDTTATWRIPFGIQIIPATLLIIGILFMPFSPRWLLDHDRDEEAIRVLARLRSNGDPTAPQVMEEFNHIKEEINFEREHSVRSYSQLLRRPIRRRLVLGVVIQILQQLTGINVIMYYAPTIFQQAGLSGTSASLLATGINGCVNILATIPAILYVDRWGRRKTLLSGSTIMGIAYLIIGCIIATKGTKVIDPDGSVSVVMANKAASFATIVFVYVFVAGFAFSWGPIGWIYPSEIFPLHVRAKATSISTAANWLFNFALGQVAPILLEKITWGLYIIFAALAVVSIGIVYFFFPETKGKSLEEMDEVFGVSGDYASPRVKHSEDME